MKKIYYFILVCAASIANAQVGTTCSDPIIISSLPYTTADNTANYADNYDIVDPSSTGNGNAICPPAMTFPYSSQSPYAGFYMSGNDVIYSYTPASSGTIKIEIPAAPSWSSMYLYTSCANIGVTAAACSMTTSSGNRTIDNFAVTAGQTYYILISSWQSPQTIAYTLNVTQLSLDVNDINNNKKAIGVYLNSAGDELNFKSDTNIVSANIYSMEGRKVSVHANVKNNKISVRELPTAKYIVEFYYKNGEVMTRAFFKK
ncbi:T9SS type A sorting domain-containing protein [Chryseobacterium terrae]|uniref:T9SS type A sorting domain-containing protein n=1 Tax=Chryseobacterium terrae TaxID=3163299 RepID=A0ABW8Y1E1_9FLAO